MGLKSGSRDAELDDDEDEESEPESSGEPLEEVEADADGDPGPDSDFSSKAPEESDSDDTDSRPSMDSIPYKLRRDKVNEGRQQVPYFLRDEVVAAEGDLQDELERILGEDVYKSDYREAAMVVAQRNPELVAAVLREWGYDLN